MKHILLKTLLFLVTIPLQVVAEKLSTDQESDQEHISDCAPHTDYEYKKLLVGQWRFDTLIVHRNIEYYANIEFGTTGTVKLTMLDTNNPLHIFNEAYGYYDMKNSRVTVTFYNETRPEVGFANNEAYVSALNCACTHEAIINFKSTEFSLKRV